MSVPKVAGGALASVTAAYVGSYLGVAGTFWGAGLTSVVITVGGSVYQRSLERTREKANATAAKAALLRAMKQPSPANAPRVPRFPDAEPTRRFGPVAPSSNGMHWPGGAPVVNEPSAEPARVLRPQRPPHEFRRTRRRWLMVGGSGALMFLLCMLVVTGWEGVTGRPLSGGEGTTVGRVLAPARSHEHPAPSEEPSTSDPKQAPSSSPEPTVSQQTEQPPEQTSVPPSPVPSQDQPSPVPRSPGRSTAPEPSTGSAPTGGQLPARQPASAPPETGGFSPQGDSAQ